MTRKQATSSFVNNRIFSVGLLLLVIGLLASALLSLKHIWLVHLPGCGEIADCDSILRSRWGSIFNLPVAFIGLAYFCAMLFLWISSKKKNASVLIKLLSTFGVLGSVAMIAAMWLEHTLCVWCLAVHVANFGFWLLAIFAVKSTKSTPIRWTQLARPGIVFIVVLVACALLKWSEQGSALDTAAREGESSIAKMSDERSTSGSGRFGGRFWLGGEEKPVRIVLFQDYQCELCQQVEFQIRKLMTTRTDIALSVKQWPFDRECNNNILMESLHPGACVASKLAEAVGLVGGNDAFWTIHNWLVDRGGQYTSLQLMEELKLIGVDSSEFEEARTSARVNDYIQQDIREGMALGLKFTPMVFVNGYEIRGWQSPEVIPAAIQKAADLAARAARHLDQPELPIERLYQEWNKQVALTFALWPDDAIRGDTTANDTIMVFADITCPYNAEAEAILEPLLPSLGNYCYVFREFPLDADCNDLVTREINPMGCEASQLATAALIASGSEAYWKIHHWIVAHRTTFSPADLERATAESGVTSRAVSAAINAPQVADHIKRCVGIAKAMNLNSSPTIYINGKLVSEWRTPGLLARIIKSVSTPNVTE